MLIFSINVYSDLKNDNKIFDKSINKRDWTDNVRRYKELKNFPNNIPYTNGWIRK